MALQLILVITALILIYKWATANFSFFKNQNIKFINPVPFFGSYLRMYIGRENFFETSERFYNEFSKEQVVGIFEFRRPVLLLRDPNLVKLLSVKEFSSFMDHRPIVPEESGSIFAKTLPMLRGQRWKAMRSSVSPTFSSLRMREIFNFTRSMMENNVIQKFHNEISKNKDGAIEFKSIMTKITVDIFTFCAFGIEQDSFKNPKNDFYRIALRMKGFGSVISALKLFGILLFPTIMKFLRITAIDKEGDELFISLIINMMKNRSEKGIFRDDLINLLIEAKKKHSWDDLDLVGQCLVLFMGGYETISTTFSYLVHELACNQEVQEKLYNEILMVNQSLNGENLSYEKLNEMSYMKQTMLELFRKWNSFVVSDRYCNEDYELKLNDRTLLLKEGMGIFIPLWSFHRDPKYFPNPEKFDPDRFSPENTENNNFDAYFPFGMGPRRCIGERYANLQIKTLTYFILLNFRFDITENTQVPIQFEKIPVLMKPKNGIWLAMKPRIVEAN